MIGIKIMKYITSSLLFIFFLIAITVRSEEIPLRDRCSGYWAAAAISPYPESGPSYLDPDFIPINIPAPNARVFIKATSKGLLLVGKNTSTHIEVYPPLMEILWSPESKIFVINVSDGGLVGSWDAKFFSISKDDLPVFLDVLKEVRPFADKFLRCEPKQEANIGVVAWLNDDKEALIIAEVPPHSSCPNMGAIQGFRVLVESGKIIERISEPVLRKKWRHVLGCRLLRGQ